MISARVLEKYAPSSIDKDKDELDDLANHLEEWCSPSAEAETFDDDGAELGAYMSEAFDNE